MRDARIFRVLLLSDRATLKLPGAQPFKSALTSTFAQIEAEHPCVSGTSPRSSPETGRVSLHLMSQDVETLIDLGFKAYGRGDNTQAARWWRMAAAQRRSDAMVNLGLLTDNPADREEATQWFFRAALLGNTDGMLLLSGILQEQGDHVIAQSWLQKAADLGDPRAIEALTQARNTPRRMETAPKRSAADQLNDLTLVD